MLHIIIGIGIYPKRTVVSTVHFIGESVLEEKPFPIERIQIDRGNEPFAYEAGEYL